VAFTACSRSTVREANFTTRTMKKIMSIAAKMKIVALARKLMTSM
jgi:hypothetical protein